MYEPWSKFLATRIPCISFPEEAIKIHSASPNKHPGSYDASKHSGSSDGLSNCRTQFGRTTLSLATATSVEKSGKLSFNAQVLYTLQKPSFLQGAGVIQKLL